MVSKMWAVTWALPGCSGVDPVARNMVLGFRYFSFRLLSPSTCAIVPCSKSVGSLHDPLAAAVCSAEARASTMAAHPLYWPQR